MKVLIVEDDLSLGATLRESLERLNHDEVRVCTTGLGGVDAVRGNAYGCVFVDLNLPDMNGIRLLNEIKKYDPTLPVVMMSGYPTMEYTIQALRCGASDFLTKPFSMQNLVLTLERVTRERNLLLENLSLKLESSTRHQLEAVNRQLEMRVREQTKLFEISRHIDQIRSSDDLYRHVVEMGHNITGAKAAGLFFLTPEQTQLVCIVCHSNGAHRDSFRTLVQVNRDEVHSLAVQLDKSPILSEKMALCLGASSEGVAPSNSRHLCWPIRIRGELFGFLAFALCSNGFTTEPGGLKLVDFLVKKTSLAIENMALYENLMANFYGILKSLVNALEARDPYTGKHSERVTGYAVRTAEHMGREESQVEVLRTVGHLHDIGKMGIEDRILNKAGPLTSEEYEIIKQHPVIGASIISDLGLGHDERAVILHHHERWDGSGYPQGLSGEDIPFVARIIAVADAYDAMTSKRAYRNAMSPEDALRELERNKGKQFDSQVVDAFSDVLCRKTSS